MHKFQIILFLLKILLSVYWFIDRHSLIDRNNGRIVKKGDFRTVAIYCAQGRCPDPNCRQCTLKWLKNTCFYNEILLGGCHAPQHPLPEPVATAMCDFDNETGRFLNFFGYYPTYYLLNRPITIKASAYLKQHLGFHRSSYEDLQH